MEKEKVEIGFDATKEFIYVRIGNKEYPLCGYNLKDIKFYSFAMDVLCTARSILRGIVMQLDTDECKNIIAYITLGDTTLLYDMFECYINSNQSQTINDKEIARVLFRHTTTAMEKANKEMGGKVTRLEILEWFCKHLAKPISEIMDGNNPFGTQNDSHNTTK